MKLDIEQLMRIVREGAEVFEITRNGINVDAQIGIRGFEHDPESGRPIRYIRFFPDADPRVGDVMRGRASGESMTITKISAVRFNNEPEQVKAYYEIKSVTYLDRAGRFRHDDMLQNAAADASLNERALLHELHLALRWTPADPPSGDISSRPSRLLFLTSNPSDTGRLQLVGEGKVIEGALRMSRNRDAFKFHKRDAVTADDLRQVLLDFEPHLVHFSGHGLGGVGTTKGGEIDRDLKLSRADPAEGLAFEDEDGQAKLISGDALAELFRLSANHVKCVILNACYSQEQAAKIHQFIDYVVGMSRPIADEAALGYSAGFYTALGAGRSIQDAHSYGCNAIQLAGMDGHQIPKLLVK